jgi:hypothetical protein
MSTAAALEVAAERLHLHEMLIYVADYANTIMWIRSPASTNERRRPSLARISVLVHIP